MRALTVYQPWASLIMIGAKPYEFRQHDYRKRNRSIEGKRIVIHAAARQIRLEEVQDLMYRTTHDEFTPNHRAKTLALCTKLSETYRGRGLLELAAGLGTAVIGTPIPVTELFKDKVADSDRLDHSKWAWPMLDVRPFPTPVPCRGFQGFWTWPYDVAA